MNRRRLLVACGLVVLAILFVRRRRHRRGIEIEIEESDTSPTTQGGDDLESIDGIGPAYAARLRAAGVDDVAALGSMDAHDVARQSGIAERRIRSWVEQARERR